MTDFDAITATKAHTFRASDTVFPDPHTDVPWAYAKITDARIYWATILKRAGIRIAGRTTQGIPMRR